MAVPPGYALFISSALRRARGPAGHRRRAVQGPAAGRARAGRGPLRPRRRRPRADRRRRLRREVPRRRHARTSGSACPATRSASGGWASTAGSAASRTRGPAGRREPLPLAAAAGRPGRGGRRRRARPACRPRSPRPRRGPRRDGVRARPSRRRSGAAGGHACPAGPSSATSSATSSAECARLGVRCELRRARSTRTAVRRAAIPTPSSSPPAPSPAGRTGRLPEAAADAATACDVRDGARPATAHGRAATGRRRRRARLPPGDVGRRAARRPRLRRSRCSPRAWSSARTSGITLDMEGW